MRGGEGQFDPPEKTTLKKPTIIRVRRFSTLHSRLTEHLQTCVVVGNVPTWMTKGKTTLIQKDPEKGNAAKNYHHVAGLPFMWKLLTSVFAVKVYAHLSEKNVLPDEQNRCRKDSRGTKDQLFLIDKEILKRCKKHQCNLTME